MSELRNLSNQQVVAQKVLVADSFLGRAVGLLGKKELPGDRTLWIHDCQSIHTFFMRFTIDAVFVDKDLTITKIVRNLKPWRMTLYDFKAASVFEFSSAHKLTEGLKPGDRLHVGS